VTVTAQTPINSSAGNGVTTVYPYTFKIINAADILVSVNGASQVLNVDYTVSGVGVDAGGNVTFAVAPAVSALVVRQRSMALTRTTDYQDQGELPAATLDNDIDAVVLMLQQVDAKTARSMLLPAGLAGFSSELPTPVADYYLRVNAAGTAYELAALVASGAITVTPYIETLLNDSSAADARTTLGATTVGNQVFVAANAAAARTAIGAAASGANNDIVSLGALTTVPAVVTAAMTPPVRQTVLSGPVDTNGLAAFGGSTGSTTVTAAGTLTATASNGVAGDRTGSIVNPSWAGLSTNGSMFLYLDIAANGTCTTGSTTLAPTYRWGGADVTTNNQFTFNIQEMVGKVGNGATAAQTYRVFVGEVTVAGAVVTAITWYALMGRYDSGLTATLPAAGVAISRNSFIGVADQNAQLILQCTTADGNYAVGDRITSSLGYYSASALAETGPWTTRNTVGFTTAANTPFVLTNKTTGNNAVLAAASWSYKLITQRTW
jgi:hypothetical protein